MTIYTSQNSSNERRQEKTRFYVTAESSPDDDVTAEKQQRDEKVQMLPVMTAPKQQQHLQQLCKVRRWSNVYLFNVCVAANNSYVWTSSLNFHIFCKKWSSLLSTARRDGQIFTLILMLLQNLDLTFFIAFLYIIQNMKFITHPTYFAKIVNWLIPMINYTL